MEAAWAMTLIRFDKDSTIIAGEFADDEMSVVGIAYPEENSVLLIPVFLVELLWETHIQRIRENKKQEIN